MTEVLDQPAVQSPLGTVEEIMERFRCDDVFQLDLNFAVGILTDPDGPEDTDQAGRIDRIARLKRLVHAAEAALALETLAFADTERDLQRSQGVKARDLGRGIAEQIAFATQDSPAAARGDLAMHRNLRDRFPQCWAAYRDGRVSQRQARQVVTQASHLDETTALAVDAAVAGQLPGWNFTQTEQGLRHVVYAIDPKGFVDRRAKAEADRRVWTKPAPDCMVNVAALLPVARGVGVYANLQRSADAIKATGDTRTKDQIMADLFVQRLTGQADAAAVPVEIVLSMPADTLLGGTAPGWLDGHGPVTADHARDIATSGADRQAKAWIRRLFTDPATGVAVDMDPTKRFFTGQARDFIARRDRQCSHPYCAAPIRHADHLEPVAAGGTTTLGNGQGLCAAGNLTKDLPGWHTSRDKQTGDTIVTTPTGQRYRTAPTRLSGLPRTTRRE